MKVYILSAYEVDQYNFAFQNLKKSSLYDPFKKYVLEEDPKKADIIIFVEHHHPRDDPYFFQVIRHPLYKRYKKKCYLYHDDDNNISLLSTISPSICKSKFNKKIQHPYHYLEQISLNPYIHYEPQKSVEKKYLFSFMGACRTYPPVRDKIMELYQGDKNIHDTKNSNSWDLNDEDRDVYFKNYAEILVQSKFILCPRGIGPSSYRQFESMKLGIAPVIISDEWIPIIGIDWDSCSISIPESKVSQIESILKSRENEYIELGANARKNYEKFMSFENQFHFLSDAAATLHSYRKDVTVLDYISEYIRFFEPFHFRNLLRYYKNKYIK